MTHPTKMAVSFVTFDRLKSKGVAAVSYGVAIGAQLRS